MILPAPPTTPSMSQLRRLSLPAYFVCLALLLLPLADVLTTLFPWQFGDARWRFGAVGLVSNALLLPMAGLLIALAAARVAEHGRMRVAIGVVSAAAATLCLVALVLFGLDALQTRAAVRPEMRTSFNVASITAALKTLVAGVTFSFLALAARAGPQAGTASQHPALFPADTQRSTVPAGR